jgi:YidC/Oxa1 family membrane protein insertase
LIITTPLGFIIEKIYGLVNNYGWAIIIFTVIIKMIVLPLTIKSQKAMKKQQKIQPIIAELQEKYKNDQEKLQTEMMKIYRENDISMTGGCLPMLIQMPILIGLYQVIQKPLSFLMHVDFNSADAINKVIDLQSRISETGLNIGSLKTATMENLAKMSQIQLAKWSEMLNGSSDPWVINFNFLGMDLSNAPIISVQSMMRGDFSDVSTILLIVIPVIAITTTWFVSKQSQMMTQAKQTDEQKKKAQDDPSAQMTKSMTMMMPIMTGFFTFTLPSGLGIYWIISNIMQIIQQFCLNKYFDKKEDNFDVKLPQKSRKNSKKRR